MELTHPDRLVENATAPGTTSDTVTRSCPSAFTRWRVKRPCPLANSSTYLHPDRQWPARSSSSTSSDSVRQPSAR